jgi:hypothetical protein
MNKDPKTVSKLVKRANDSKRTTKAQYRKIITKHVGPPRRTRKVVKPGEIGVPMIPVKWDKEKSRY